MLVAVGLAACGSDDAAEDTGATPAPMTTAGDRGQDGASATSAAAVPTATPTETASPDTSAPDTSAPDTTPPETDREVDDGLLARLDAIVVQAADLPADRAWVQEPASEGEEDAVPTDCLGLAFDAVGVQDLDASDGATQTNFSAPDAPSFLTFGAASSDPVPDLERLRELVAACDGVTDPDGTNYIVVPQPQMEVGETSIAFAINADQGGSMFNLVFVMSQRDDVTLLSASTAVVGEADPEVLLIVEMMQLMLERV